MASFNFSLNDFMDQKSFHSSVLSSQTNYTPNGQAKALKTTESQGEVKKSLTTWNVSDILQGSVTYKPLGLDYTLFNESTSRLADYTNQQTITGTGTNIGHGNLLMGYDVNQSDRTFTNAVFSSGTQNLNTSSTSTSATGTPASLSQISYIPAKNFTTGRVTNITMIVIHDMEAGEESTTAENCASYFSSPTAPEASAHYACDNDSTVCCVLPQNTAWHSAYGPTNNCSIGIEQAGYANQGISQSTGWNDEYSQAMIRTQVAPLCAKLINAYDIPITFLSADDLKNGNFSGITSHWEISKAFVPGGHTDPGPDYPWNQLLSEITQLVWTTA